MDFYSTDQAELFMKIFAGSTGDPNAAQLIVENRAVTLEYARETTDRPQCSYYGNGDQRGREREERDAKGGSHSAGLDWICSTCKGHNFSRRNECYRCSAKRTPTCVTVPRGSGPLANGDNHRNLVRADDLESTTPSEILLVRGLNPSIDEQYVSDLFRPYAMVKNVTLIRDPSSQFATHLAYIEFYSTEHALYALQSYNNASSGVCVAMFANVKAMQRLQKEVTQPGSALACNPMVAQALQVAQWSANIGNTAPPTVLPTTAPPPPPTAPSGVVDLALSYEQQQQYAQYALYQQQTLQVQQQALLQQQLRWPPHFETNGGSYVYQAKTGCFLEPTSEFYFDPKSKLYYCGKNGAYYSFDEAYSPPFRRFVPPPPAAASLSERNSTVVISTTNVGAVPTSSTIPSSTTNVSPAVSTSNTTNKVTLGVKTTVGFGLSSAKNKKVKVDLAKWSALQQDDGNDEEDEKEGNAKNKEDKPLNVSPATVVAPENEKSLNVTRIDSVGLFESQEPKVGSKRPLKNSVDAFLAEFMASSEGIASKAPVVPASAINALPPPPPPGVRVPLTFAPGPTSNPAPVVARPVGVTSVTIGSNVVSPPSLPVCLLCQRQFPSFEMLQRHEKESKLHAENLKKV